MGDDVPGPWAGARSQAAGTPRRAEPVPVLPLTRPCPHETPGGSQKCALCRAEVTALHRKAARRREHEPVWKALTPSRPTPMPAFVRAELDRLAGKPGPAKQEPLPLLPERACEHCRFISGHSPICITRETWWQQ